MSRVIHLHPVGLDGRMWDGVAGDGALAPSFPGFGDTPPDGVPSFDALVAFVAGLIDEPAHLVGVSLGSMVAQHVALARPELVRSLVLACGAGRTNADALRDRARATRETGMEGVLPSTLERWFTAPALADAGHPGVAYARDRLLADDPEVFAAYWEQMAAHDLLDALGGVRVPTTVIAGRDDRASPVAAMRELAGRIPGAAFEVLDGPHMLPLENGAGFAGAVERHLARVG